MAETTTENTTTEAVAAGVVPAKKKGGKKLIIIILMVVLLGGAAGGYFYLRRSSAAAETTEKPEKDAKKSNSKKDSKGESDETDEKSSKSTTPALIEDALPEDEDVKHIIELQPFIVNLADDDQARYLRMTVSLGIGGESAETEKPDTIFVTRVRNAMLAVLSVKKSEDVLTVKGKAQLRKELLKAAQAASEEPQVLAIYITDFIVQL